MTDQRLLRIEEKLDNHGDTLGEIQKTLNLLAVQNERITTVQKQVADLWKKYDELAHPNTGMLSVIKNFQASCPRESIKIQLKWLWCTLVPLMITQIAVAIRLIK